jgi:CheY-like chemotaxis protein
MSHLSKILCAEDDPDIRMILEFSLAKVGGYTLCLCTDGTEALLRAPAFAPDLILLDVMMPGITGPETLHALRKIPALAQTAVVLMSAKALPQEIQALLELGAAGLIVKPFDPMTLPETLNIYWNCAREKQINGA